MDSTLAVVDYGEMGAMITGFFLVVVVPLVAILLSHQRKMAAYFHGNMKQPEDQAKLDRLEAEVRELKDRITQLILVGESRREIQERVSPPHVSEHR